MKSPGNAPDALSGGRHQAISMVSLVPGLDSCGAYSWGRGGEVNATDSSGRRNKRVSKGRCNALTNPTPRKAFAHRATRRSARICARHRSSELTVRGRGSPGLALARPRRTLASWLARCNPSTGAKVQQDALGGFGDNHTHKRCPSIPLFQWPNAANCGQRLPPAAGPDALAPPKTTKPAQAWPEIVCASVVRAFLSFSKRLIAPSRPRLAGFVSPLCALALRQNSLRNAPRLPRNI